MKYRSLCSKTESSMYLFKYAEKDGEKWEEIKELIVLCF